ncbi:MAG: hypothetical protein MUF71_21435 [Candidatus Kapabacteria bacterium]|nr:hypothetical protein [Candidatus Kapabacteria bacterium]
MGASRLAPTELVASGDGKAARLHSGGLLLYNRCSNSAILPISSPAPERRVRRIF